VFWGILQRTIFLELLRVFLLALCALTGLVLMAGIVAEATQRGLGPGQILAVIPLLIPNMLPYTLPTTTLFATCVVYGRLAADNEILAIKAAGIHIVHILSPAIFLGVLASAATFFLYLDTIPVTHWIMRSQIVSDIDELVLQVLKKDLRFQAPGMNTKIFVERVEGRKLIKAHFFIRQDPKVEGSDIVAFAREAEMRFDLKNNQILVHMRNCYIAGNGPGADAFVENKVWPIELPKDFNKAQLKSRATDMTWKELWEQRDLQFQKKAEIDQDVASHQVAINLGGAPPNFPEHIQQRLNQRKTCDSQLDSIDAELNMRPAFALGCLCFVLVGCPIGIWFSKSDYLSAFITCFLPIVIVYYPLMLCAINMAKSGRIPAWQGIWFADELMALAAAVLFVRLARN
jgi:lipopolysaccharide export system permease protein